MSLLGATRIFGFYRFCNMLALPDDKIRGTGPEKSLGGRGWDSYTRHTDLPPAIHGARHADQRIRPELRRAREDDPFARHELDHDEDARQPLADRRRGLKGTKVVNVSVEYPRPAAAPTRSS